MRIKSIFSIMLVILLGASILPLGAVTIVDDFNRASLGSNWSADPEYAIVTNTLSNTSTVGSWDYVAVYTAQASPSEVSMTFASTATTAGANASGLCMFLSSSNVSNAEGYMVMRRNEYLYLLPVVNGNVIRETEIAKVTATLGAPTAGDKITVAASSDASGYHFDFYINGNLDGRVTDAGKLYGNSYFYYSGVALFGNSSNNVDDFTLRAETIDVTSPSGGEVWLVGSAETIAWDISEFSDDVQIEYSTDSGATWTDIVSSTTNTGTYAWTIPNAPSENCLVRVSDAADGVPWGISTATFEITAEVQTVTVTSPNGGETWASSSAHDITWTSEGTIANVSISYSTDSGTTWTSIVASTPNDGSYSWTVPTVTTSTALVRVQDTDASPTDQSDAVFNISSSQVVLSVQSGSGEQDEDVTINVLLENQVPIRGVLFRLTDTPNELTATDVLGVGRASTFDVTFDESGTYVQVLIANTTSFTSIPAGSGAIAQINFHIDPAVTYGTTSSLTFSNVALSDDNNQAVVPSLVSGLFHYVLTGDIVPTGTVDNDDIDRMAEIILGTGDPATDIERLAGDIDQDGDIDVYDALAVVDLANP